MTFSKNFPKEIEGSSYPRWVEIKLTESEEKEQERLCRERNIEIMKECIEDAKSIIKEKGLKDFQTNQIQIAIALFEKRSSHEIYWKENKAKEKFDSK